jgi:cytochrome c biogenesis protein ResB
MADMQDKSGPEEENESYPVEPRYHPVHRMTRRIYDVLASVKLAMALLIIILVCCVLGVTVWRGGEAGRVIFGTLWFNGILVLLVVNIACCFFGRIWGRRVTVVSLGMILFHLSFVLMLLAIAYNSLFYFRGSIRLTEGEVLPSSDMQSYDAIDKGRYFGFTRLRGETSLIKMHTGYKVSGEDKRAAYEISVGEEKNRTQDIIYITHKMTHRGVDYFNDKEGYSLLLMLSDRTGQELYGVHVPLQSIVLGKDRFEYSTGYSVNGVVTKEVIPFPVSPERPAIALQVEYVPAKLKERAGDVRFLAYPLNADGFPAREKALADGKTAVGEKFKIGDYFIEAKEVRYWVGMLIRYEPGKPIVLASLWIGLGGMIITTIGRMARKRS